MRALSLGQQCQSLRLLKCEDTEHDGGGAGVAGGDRERMWGEGVLGSPLG